MAGSGCGATAEDLVANHWLLSLQGESSYYDPEAKTLWTACWLWMKWWWDAVVVVAGQKKSKRLEKVSPD